MRMRAVKAVCRGQSVESVAAACGLKVRTLLCWLSEFATGGQKALPTNPVPGRPPKVSGEQTQRIARSVPDASPQQFKLPVGLWTSLLIGKLVERRSGKGFWVASVTRIMKLLGLIGQKPLFYAWQQDLVLVCGWESETYPQIRAEASRAAWSACFADNPGIRFDYHARTTWAPTGQAVLVRATSSRLSMNMISAVSARDGFQRTVHEGTVTAGVVKRFLQRLLVGPSSPSL